MRKWKTIRQIDNDIPAGSVLSQVRNMDIVSSTNGTMQNMLRMNPNKSLVVVDHGGKQKILQVGRDIIPHSQGVGSRR
tara:strand:+ start:549 stop:782 length:234 start_codon:yes stop_codon:yes gene_type:complete